jgi:hypothetical protein
MPMLMQVTLQQVLSCRFQFNLLFKLETLGEKWFHGKSEGDVSYTRDYFQIKSK